MRPWVERLRESPYLACAIMVMGYAIMQQALACMVQPNHTFRNVRWYFDIVKQMDAGGVLGVWTPYPPLFAGFMYLLGKAASNWPAFLLSWKVLNLALVFGIALVTYGMVAPYGRPTAFAAALGYLLINMTTNSAITVGYYFDQFDYVPILIMTVALYLVARNRPVESGVLCGLGALVKLFPVLVVPVAVLALDRRKGVLHVLGFAATCAIVLLPLLLFSPSTLGSFYDFTGSRDAWETIWHFPQVKFPPVPRPGELVLPFSSSARPYAWLTVLASLVMLGCLWWHGRQKTARGMARELLSLLLVLLLFAKGISCYFIFWLFPALFAIYKPVYAFLVCSALMLVGNIEFAFAHMPRDLAYWIAIFGRHALLLWLLIESILDRPSRWLLSTVR